MLVEIKRFEVLPDAQRILSGAPVGMCGELLERHRSGDWGIDGRPVALDRAAKDKEGYVCSTFKLLGRNLYLYTFFDTSYGHPAGSYLVGAESLGRWCSVGRGV